MYCDYFFSFEMIKSVAVSSTIFGFGEFVSALALLVIIYTISSIRYKFRLSIAPFPLFELTFFLIGFIGFGTLLSDVWFSKGWLVPNFLADQIIWQGMFGFLFLFMALMWIYYAFINPPIFSKRNYSKYAQAIYRYILQGSKDDLPIIAQEIERSAEEIVKTSNQIQQREEEVEKSNSDKKPSMGGYAHDILLLIGNRKFCRYVIESSPITAMTIFDTMSKLNKLSLPVSQFAINISTEAIINKDSILYHEDEGYSSGLIGMIKPFSRSIYGNYRLVERLGGGFNSPLDLDYTILNSLDESQFEAYTRAAKITFKNYLSEGLLNQHSYSLNRCFHNIEYSCNQLYMIDGVEQYSDFDSVKKLRISMRFFEDIINMIEDDDILNYRLRLRENENGVYQNKDKFDHIADNLFEIIFSVSQVRAPEWTCWGIQHNSVWSKVFSLPSTNKSWEIIQFKLRRLLFDEIKRLEKFPNWKSSKILAMCLNVMGLELGEKDGYGKEYYALKKAVIFWTKKNYMKLRSRHHEIADDCLIRGISFDKENSRLVYTHPKNLDLTPRRTYLELDGESLYEEEAQNIKLNKTSKFAGARFNRFKSGK